MAVYGRRMPIRLVQPAAFVFLTALVLGCGGDGGTPPATTPGARATPATTPTTLAKVSNAKVTDITIGSAVGADHRVTTPTASFAPGDVVYVSVQTDSPDSFRKVAVRWHDPTNSVTLIADRSETKAGPLTTEFKYSSPRGLARGTWTAEVWLDGVVKGSRTFEVR